MYKAVLVFFVFSMVLSRLSLADCENLKIFVIRHGSAEHLLEKTRNSSSLRPYKHLTNHGVREVYEAARKSGLSREEIVELISSPLMRTRETAALLWNALPENKDHPFYNLIDQEKAPPSKPEAESTDVQDTKLDDEVKLLLVDVVRNTRISRDTRIIDRNFGPCEGARTDSDCYRMIGSNGRVNKESIESKNSIHDRVLDFLKDIHKRYCSNNYPTTKYLIVSTHDVIVVEIEKILSPHPSTEKVKPGEFKILDLQSPLLSEAPSSGDSADAPISLKLETPKLNFDLFMDVHVWLKRHSESLQ